MKESPLKEVQLELCTWRDIDEYLGTRQSVLVPIGSTEQHGPNGLIGTDHICAEYIADAVGQQTGTLVAPPIRVGMALHHMAFPGSISLRPETLIEVIRDYVWSLSHHGFEDIVFVNGHGGNIATATAAFSALREEFPDVRLRWVNWYEAEEVKALAAELFGDREGSHATPGEISVTMVARPGVVEPLEGPVEVKPSQGIPGSLEFRQAYPDGRIASDPTLASPENGERLVDAAVRSIVDLLSE